MEYASTHGGRQGGDAPVLESGWVWEHEPRGLINPRMAYEVPVVHTPYQSLGCRAASVAIGALIASAGAARAQTSTWTNSAGGNWGASANWAGGVLPDSTRLVYFDNSAGGTTLAFTVNMTGNATVQACKTLNVLANSVTLNYASASNNLPLSGGVSGSASLMIGGGFSDPVTLMVLNTGLANRKLSGVDAWIGAGTNSLATLAVRGGLGQATFAGDLRIGNAGPGAVVIDQGGYVSARALRVGYGALVQGSISIDGANSKLEYGTTGAQASIAENGPAVISITNGGTLRAAASAPLLVASTDLVNHSGATITIDGAGSSWQTGSVTGAITLGKYGPTQITLTNGGSLISASSPFYLGTSLDPYDVTTVTIGLGSQWTHTGGMVRLGYNSITQGLVPATGILRLEGGQCSNAGNAVTVYGYGAISGFGTISAAGVALGGGLISPDGGTPGSYGTLAINGGLGVLVGAGRIELDVRGDDAGPHDAITVSSSAAINCALIVRSAGALPDLSNSLALPLFSAASFSGGVSPAFRVALLPSLPGNRFYRLSYPGPSGGTITLGVQSLFNTPDFNGGSANSTVNAVITAADRGDLSGDGLDDLAVTTSDGFVFILTGNGDGTFSQTIQLPVGNDPRGVVIVDLDPANPNNNGKEVVVSNSADDTLTVYSRTGAGTWFVAATPATGPTPLGLCAADFNGDGIEDIVCADSGSNSASYFRGQSGTSISLAARTSHQTDNGPVDVDPWDPDNTKGGMLSLVTSNRGSGTMSFLHKNPGGGFDPPVNFATGAGPFQVITGDLNLDGNSDVATLNDDGTMTIFISDGAGSFLNGAPVPVGDAPLSFARADLDLDGDLDIAVVADNESAMAVVKVFRNDTDPFDNNLTLASPSEVSTPTPQIVLTGKVDPDSRPDLITVGSGPRTLTTVTTVANSSLCPADFDQNGFVNGADFDAFVIEFYYGTLLADFDHNGFVNGVDFDGFTAAFVAGC